MVAKRRGVDLQKYARLLPHYLPLVGIFGAGALAFWLFSYDRQFQIGVVAAVAVSHVVWGMVHHYLMKDLSMEVVMEYVAVSLLGISVILSIIFWA